jgi:DNA-binding response OmpR family regulator
LALGELGRRPVANAPQVRRPSEDLRMRDVWLYARQKEDTHGVAAALVEFGYRPRYVAEVGRMVPFGDGADRRPPELAIVVTASGDPIPLGLLRQLSSSSEFNELPVLVALDPEHLRSTPEVALSHEFLVKPFSAEELRLRITQATRKRLAVDAEVIRVGSIELNLATYSVVVDRCPVRMRYMEYELLKFLITHPNRAFSRQALLSGVWGYDYYGGARTVDVHIRRLRLKLGEHAARIRTVRSVGYLFDPTEDLCVAAV